MTDTKELRKLAEAATPGPWNYYDDSLSTGRIEIVALGKTVTRIYRSVPEEDGANAEFIAAANPQTIIALLDTIEAQAAEIEELKASTITHCEWYAARNQITHQAALLKQCWGYFNEIRMNDDQNRWTCDQAIAAIEQWENGK